MLDAFADILAAHDPVLGLVVMMLMTALAIVWKRMTKFERGVSKAIDSEREAKDQLLDQAREQGALMRDVEHAIVSMTTDRESRILHQARLETLMNDVRERL